MKKGSSTRDLQKLFRNIMEEKKYWDIFNKVCHQQNTSKVQPVVTPSNSSPSGSGLVRCKETLENSMVEAANLSQKETNRNSGTDSFKEQDETYKCEFDPYAVNQQQFEKLSTALEEEVMTAIAGCRTPLLPYFLGRKELQQVWSELLIFNAHSLEPRYLSKVVG